MSWVAAAIVGGAAIGAGGSYLSSQSASKDAKKINQQTLSEQARLAEQQRGDFEPYRQVGLSALPQYYQMLGMQAPEGAAFEVPTGAPELSPLAQWQQQEFLKTQNRQDAARGLAGSGGASARIGEGTMQIAGQDWMNQYSRILDALKVGTNASASAGAASQQLSGQVGQAGRNSMDIALDQGQTNANLWQGLGGLPADYMNYQNRQPSQPQVTTQPLTNPWANYSPGAAATSEFLGGSAGVVF